MKVSILDIAKVICSITPDCSDNIHEWDDLEYYIQIRYIEEAKKFMEIANILIEKIN